MGKMTIRDVRDDDWPAILDLAHRSISESQGLPSQQEWLHNRRSFAKSDEIQHHFVATSDERIVGYACAEHRSDASPGDYRLFVVVAPSDRSSLGATLLAKLRQLLIALDARRAWFLEYEALAGFVSWLEEMGFVRVESFNLGDGTPLARLAMDSPFRPGATPSWRGTARDASLGARFSSRRTAENYRFRPPYSREVFAALLGLLDGKHRILLDAGCGPGKITLGLIDHLDRSDAVDPSAEMLRVARSLPNADSPKIRWINSRIEDASLSPPYGLVVAALSLHWMDLDRVLPKFGAALAPDGFLAVLDGDAPVDAPWEREESAFMADFVGTLESKRHFGWKNARQQLNQPKLMHRLYQPAGFRITAPFEIWQSVTDYLRCQHSRATWSEDHLGEEASATFDAEMTAILNRHTKDGMLRFAVQTRIEWGRVTTEAL